VKTLKDLIEFDLKIEPIIVIVPSNLGDYPLIPYNFLCLSSWIEKIRELQLLLSKYLGG